jgi:hypothetical protein
LPLTAPSSDHGEAERGELKIAVQPNSLFRSILHLTHCDSIFCAESDRHEKHNSCVFNILTHNDEKRLQNPGATNFTLFKILAVKYCAPGYLAIFR